MFAIVYLVSNELIQNKQNTSTVTRDKTQRRRTHSDRGATSPDCVKHRHQRERVAVTAPPMAHLPPVSRDLLLLHDPLQHTFTVAGSCCMLLQFEFVGIRREFRTPVGGSGLRSATPEPNFLKQDRSSSSSRPSLYINLLDYRMFYFETDMNLYINNINSVILDADVLMKRTTYFN